MSSQVVRVERFTKGSLSAIGKEVERDEKDLFENRNEDIDRSRTHLNEFFKLTNNGMYNEWKETCERLNIVNANKLKKNVTAFEGMVITSDRAFFESLGWSPGEDPTVEMNDFFNQAYEFACQEIGFRGTDENILSAAIHYDETTPHLQLYYIPIVDSWKEKVYEKDENERVKKSSTGSPIQARDEKGKIIYNRVTNSLDRRLNRSEFWQNKGGKNSYTRMQDRFQELVGKNFGLDRGEIGSTREHTTKAKWEMQKLDQDLEFGKKLIKKERIELDQLRAENKLLKVEYNTLIAENTSLKSGNIVLKDEIEKGNREIEKLENAFDEKEKKYQDLDKQIKEKVEKANEIINNANQLQREIETNKESLSNLNGEIENKKISAAKLDNEIRSKQSSINQFESRLLNIQNSLYETKITEKKILDGLEVLLGEKNSLNQEISALRLERLPLASEIGNLAKEKSNLQREVQSEKTKLETLKSENVATRTENKKIMAGRQNLYRFNRDRDNIERMVSSLKDGLKDMEKKIERELGKEIYIPSSLREWANKKPSLLCSTAKLEKIQDSKKELRTLERQEEKQQDEKERKLDAVDRMKQELDRKTESVMNAGDEYDQEWDDWEMDR